MDNVEDPMLGFNVFGRILGVARKGGEWSAAEIGLDGKHREARNVAIPPSMEEPELASYMTDIFREPATPGNPEVVRLGEDRFLG